MRTTSTRRSGLTVGVVAIGLTGCLSPAAAADPTPSNTPLYGVTIDGIGPVASVVAEERLLPERPTTRVSFDVSEPASYYAIGVSELHSVSGVMGELLDSSEATRISTGAFHARVESYLSTLGSSVDIWEIGNEVNGNWTGNYATGEAKTNEAYDDVVATGARTALTLYANEYAPDHCGDGSIEPTPIQYSKRYVPPAVRDGLTYVFESYYPTQCADTYPTNARVASEMHELHALYPNALLGFGEVGLPRAVTKKTLATAERVMSWAYSLDPGPSYYVGGYFWWYALEDAFTGRALLAGHLTSAFEDEAAALDGEDALPGGSGHRTSLQWHHSLESSAL
jgi:hypothetical protein